jgi:cell division protein FtsZ
MKGARGVLINITGGMDMTLFEVDEAANRIRDEVDPDANIIFGSTFDQSLDGKIRISVVATGIETVAQQQRPSMGGTVNLSVIASNPAPQPSAPIYSAPSIVAMEDRSIARMEMPAAHAMGQPMAPAPIVAHAQSTMAHSGPSLGTQSPAMARPLATGGITMTTQSIGATALQAQPARATVVKDEMAHLQRAAAASRATERQVEEQRPLAAPQPNGSSAPEARRSTLFEKMTSRLTGTPAGRTGSAPTAQAAGSTAAPRMQARETPRMEPRMEAPQAMAPQAQPTLNLDPSDRLSGSRAEEDLLDIPAFLRRQAN